jgi:hypothetical protein
MFSVPRLISTPVVVTKVQSETANHRTLVAMYLRVGPRISSLCDVPHNLLPL